MRSIARRDFLKLAGIGAGLGTLAAACGTPSPKTIVSSLPSVKPIGSDLGAVEHVIFLMQENRSFDHYFGAYKGVNGFGSASASDPGVFAQHWPDGPSPTLLPFHLNTSKANVECTVDLSHTWDAQHQCWNDGKLDSFVSTHTSASFEGPSNGITTMGYYDRSDLPFYYALADRFTISDAYHCSVLGPTHPNRLMSISASIDPGGFAGGPVLITNPSNSAKFSVDWPTMPEALSSAGVSWKMYNPSSPAYSPSSLLAMLVSNNPLLYFKQFSTAGSAMYQRAFGYSFEQDFAQDVRSDSLPAVSWLFAPLGFDEHPSAPPAYGEWYTSNVLNILAQNPKVWSKTVLFLSYDENDGFFDHVPPPVPPTGTEGEFVSASPLPKEASGIAGPIGLGFRVPLLTISPFSEGGYVDSAVSDHTSQLKFLEARFGVKVPNLTTWRRSLVSDLTSTLHTVSGTSTNASLPTAPQNPSVVTSECSTTDINELGGKTPPASLYEQQAYPAHEPGKPKRI